MKATDELRRDHEIILRALAVLHALADRVRKGDPVDEDSISKLLVFFRDFADGCHHVKEETALFPALVARGLPPQGGPIGVMLHEHEEGRTLLRSLTETTSLLTTDPAARERFADVACAYEGLLCSHICKENHVLFDMADRLFGAADDERLMKEFEAKARQALGDDERARLAAVPLALSARYL